MISYDNIVIMMYPNLGAWTRWALPNASAELWQLWHLPLQTVARQVSTGWTAVYQSTALLISDLCWNMLLNLKCKYQELKTWALVVGP